MMFSRKEEEDRQTKGWSASEWSGALDETLRAERGRHDDEAQARVAAAKQRTHERTGQHARRAAYSETARYGVPLAKRGQRPPETRLGK